MNRLEKTITINAPVHIVFEYVREPLNLPKLCANIVAIDDIQRFPDGTQSFQWEYKVANVRFFGTGSVTDCDVDHCLATSIRGGITGTMTWVFQPEDAGTHVMFLVDFVLPSLFLQKHGQEAVARENEAAVASLLQHLKAVLEVSAGPIIIVDEVKLPVNVV